MKSKGDYGKKWKARLLYLLLVLGYSYVLGILEVIFKSGAYYNFLAMSFTFVLVLSAVIVHKTADNKNVGHLSLKVWKNPKALIVSAFVPRILGIIFSYVTLKTGNCMFSAIMHGTINIIGELPVLCAVSKKNGLLGSNPTGLLSMGFLIIFSIISFIKMNNEAKR